MLSRVSNAGLNTYFKATSNAVRVTQIGQPAKIYYNDEPSNAIPDLRSEATSYSLSDFDRKLKARSVAVPGRCRALRSSLRSPEKRTFHSNRCASTRPGHQQVRLAHTDIKIPDLTSYRKKATKNPNKKNDQTIDERRGFTYMATAGTAIGGAVFGKAVIRDLCSILSPAKEVLALSKIEVNLDDIPLGKAVTFKWRGKPVFVKHRTEEEIQREAQVDLSTLRDPEADSDRAKQPEWLILLGVCTHLGCVPIANAGNYFRSRRSFDL